MLNTRKGNAADTRRIGFTTHGKITIPFLVQIVAVFEKLMKEEENVI